MTLPVSTSSRRLADGLLCEYCCGAVQGWVVGGVVLPAAPDDADPGAGEDADGVGVVFAGGTGLVVDAGGPGAGVAAVVGVDGDGPAEPLVAGPAEVHGAVLAGFPGDGGDPGEGGDGVGPVIGLAAVAPLGEHLGGADLTRPW